MHTCKNKKTGIFYLLELDENYSVLPHYLSLYCVDSVYILIKKITTEHIQQTRRKINI